MPCDPTHASALPEAWLEAIDEVAARRLGPHDRTGEALADEVARLSELYTRGRGALDGQRAALAARLRFFLPRDLPKIEGPLAELDWASALPRGPRWRVLDLGAGLGASSLGIATFARRAGIEGLQVLAVDRDPRALDVLGGLAARCGKGVLAEATVPIALEARELDLERLELRELASPDGAGRFSFVAIGLVLNELWTNCDDRIERRTEFLVRAAELLDEDGALVVIEPALREAARELARVRDRIVERGAPHLFAPCTRGGACPMLARERDWCHEDLPLSLPERLRSIARAAGLRWQGLSYAYLVLRRGPGALARGAYRVVGGPISSKGRTEWHACGEAGLLRIRRLDRHRREHDPLEGVGRGAILTIEGHPDASVRSDRVAMARLR